MFVTRDFWSFVLVWELRILGLQMDIQLSEYPKSPIQNVVAHIPIFSIMENIDPNPKHAYGIWNRAWNDQCVGQLSHLHHESKV